ncbi:alpha/beta fold hydrolase [Halobacteriales archaeon Cl-PHB]
MEFVAHDGRETAYRETHPDGDGPTTLYVHGSGGSHRVWAAQYGPDGPAHPAVAVDLSGHGESDNVATEVGQETLDAYADDVIAVAREVDAVVLVGNSLGGAVVQTVLLDREYDPRAAVLAGSGAKLSVLEALRDWLQNDFDRAVEFVHDDDRLFHDVDPEVLERSKPETRETGQAVTARDFLSCDTFDVRDRMDEISVPVLAIVGEHDALTPVAYHEFFAERIADCELAVVPDAAHLAFLENPDDFNAEVGAFLSATLGE